MPFLKIIIIYYKKQTLNIFIKIFKLKFLFIMGGESFSLKLENKYSSPDTTVFNMAFNTLQRMDKCLDAVSEGSFKGNLYSWYWSLLELRRLISPFISEEHMKEINNLFLKIEEKKWYKFIDKIPFLIKEEKRRVFLLLDKLTILVHRAMNDVGILMPKGDDPRQAFKRR